jgi:hypothetical protein
MSDQTLMTDAATTTEGAPTSTNAAAADATASANANAEAAQGQQATDGSASTDATNTESTEQTDGSQESDKTTESGAPEQYEFNAPEGLVIDEQTIGKFSEVAKELNLPQEAAQKILDQVAPVMAKQQTEMLQNLNAQWVEGTKSDKEIGGEKLQENLAVAQKAMKAFGTPELSKLLNESRLGNNPEVIRFMYRAGKAISEDKFVAGGNSRPNGGRDPAKSLYPNQQS